jgi:hypothetical protein
VENDRQAQPVAELEQPVLRPADEASYQESDRVSPDVPPATVLDIGEIPEPAFVYAIGQVEPRFPSLGLEKEFAQVIGRRGDEGYSDREAFAATIRAEENRYLARHLCWVFLVEGLETYILMPRDPGDYKLLIDSVREIPRRDDIDLVIGTRGHVAPPHMCNGLAVPIVVFDQLYSFDRDTLVDSIPVYEGITNKNRANFRKTAGTFFDGIMQMTDNAGATDEHRALNYLAVRAPRIYTKVAEEQERNASLSSIDVRPSPLSGVRRIVEVIFAFTHRQTDVTTKHSVRVDVTEEYPFLVTPLAPYFDR